MISSKKIKNQKKNKTGALFSLQFVWFFFCPLHGEQILNELQMLNKQNQFVTKTCLTTYTYSTTYIEDGTTKIESREKIITNTATEERNAYRIQPTATAGITLTQVR